MPHHANQPPGGLTRQLHTLFGLLSAASRKLVDTIIYGAAFRAHEPLQPSSPPLPHGQQQWRQQAAVSCSERPPPGLYVLCSGSAFQAGAEVLVCPHPVALPAAAPCGSGGCSSGSGGWCSSRGARTTRRLELELPAVLAAALEGDSCSMLRVIVLVDQQGGGALLLDLCYSADDLALQGSSPRLALHIPEQAPPSAGAGARQLVLHLLLCTSLEQPEVLVARLPLLVLPAAACSELQALFEAMVAASGGDAVAAYADLFSPLAADMAAVLQLGAFPGAAAAWIGDDNGSMRKQLAAAACELLTCFGSQEGGLPACTRLVAAAAKAHHGRPGEACGAGTCRAPSVQQRQRTPTSSLLAASVFGFTHDMESNYQRYKGQALHVWDRGHAMAELLLYAIVLIRIELAAAALPCTARMLALLRAAHFTRRMPALLCLLAPGVFLRHRDIAEFGGRLLNCVFHLAVCVPALLPSTQFALLTHIISSVLHHPSALVVIEYCVWPCFQQLTVPLHVIACMLYVVRDALFRKRVVQEALTEQPRYMIASTAEWRLSVGVACAATLLIVTCLELRLRRQFVAAAGRRLQGSS